MSNLIGEVRRTVILAACLAVIPLAACGGSDGNGNGGDNGGNQHTGEPLSLNETQLGAGITHGMVGHLRDGTETDQQNLEDIASTIDHVFLRLQAYDEQARIVGDWESFERTPNTDYNQSTFYRNNPAEGQLAVPDGDIEGRAADLVSEFRTSFPDNPPEMSMVVDFWRTRGDWYVRWDGNFGAEVNLEGQGPYGFYHRPMVQSLLDQLAHVAAEHRPQYLVVGTDMERLLATDGGEGIAPSEWSNFTRFYRLAAERIREASNQQTRPAVGINWDRFALQVTPRYVGDGEPGEVPSREALDTAIERFLQPLWAESNAIALKSYRPFDLVEDDSHYAPLANLDQYGNAGRNPLIWYSVGAPAPQGTDTRQQDFLEAFLEWNRGIDPQVVSWRMLLDYWGARDPIASRCKTFVESEDFPMDRARCFDGLYDETVTPKATMDFIQMQRSQSE